MPCTAMGQVIGGFGRREGRGYEIVIRRVEASPGIEPGCKDLQSSA